MPRRTRLICVAACAVTLCAGFALKAQCMGVEWDGTQYSRLCYNDIQALYGSRGVSENVFPYVDGRLVDGELAGGAIEYPVLTGLFMWLTGLPISTDGAYLVVSALLLAPFGLLVAYFLGRLNGARSLLWSVAPAIVLYAFHNWDLLVVTAVVVAFWLWRQERPVWAAVALGVGAALKLYPIFFLAPLFLERLRARDARRALVTAAAGLGTFALVNLPFVLINFRGWSLTYTFHADRTADFNSIWIWGLRSGKSLVNALSDTGAIAFDPARLNLVTALLTGGFFMFALGFGWWRSRAGRDYPFVQVCAAMLAAFLLWNKVHSPQYALWILPFFALLRVHWLWWAAYSIADLAVYVGIFRWFHDYGLSGDAGVMTGAKWALVWGVRGRALLLVALFGVFLAVKEAWLTAPGDARDDVASHPPSTLGITGDRRLTQS